MESSLYISFKIIFGILFFLRKLFLFGILERDCLVQDNRKNVLCRFLKICIENNNTYSI